MNLSSLGIIIEIFVLFCVALWVIKHNNRKNRQPSLSKKTIKNLKF